MYQTKPIAPLQIIDLKQSILEDNDKDAEALREELKKRIPFSLI